MRPRTRLFSLIAAFLFAALLSACELYTRTADFAPVLDVPQDAKPAPIAFSRLRVQLPTGTEIGQIRIRECILSHFKTGKDTLDDIINQSDVDDVFAETLEMQGYDVVNKLTADFVEEYEDDILRSEYKISAKIVDADIDACYDSPSIMLDTYVFGSAGYAAKLYMKVQWGVYDNLHRKVAYKTRTEGYAYQKIYNIEGLNLAMNKAFAMAAHNLGADPEFHDLIFYAREPPRTWKEKKTDQRPRKFNAQESVVIRNPPLSRQPLVKHIDRTGQAAVLISGGESHGSGYFITPQGHILTNHHVVGNARRVRVETAGNEKKYIAEVLRTNKVRDVALLRLEEIPGDFEIVTLPIRADWPRVSEEIYALGAPQMRKLRDTWSKGIVSAHRKNFRSHGAALDFIQGDVATHGGNSGGPLLDAYGNIIGMTVSGYSFNDSKADDGLNFFIPIGDALKRLDITLD